MKIGILGTGRMGSGLARSYVNAGHEVILGSRSPEKAERLANQIGDKVRGGSHREAAEEAEVVILAVGFGDAAATVQPLADLVADKIVVDMTNPFGAVPEGQTSGIEENARAAPQARWVAAYKTNFWKTLEQPVAPDGTRRDVFVCSDDEDTKERVTDLVKQTGFRAVDCGALASARTLDLMVPLMIELDQRYGTDACASWKFLGHV